MQLKGYNLKYNSVILREHWLDFCCEINNTKPNIMRKIALLFVFSLIYFSCEKDYLIPDNEVPDWLKTRIDQNEQFILDHPSSCLNYGGWLRYNWQDEYYFEYHCSCSSSSPRAISTKGDTLQMRADDVITDYYKEKCCRQLVWKAPKYEDSPW